MKREIRFDYIFLDPPYKKQQLEHLLETIQNENLLTNNGIVVCEHSKDVVLPVEVGRLKQMKFENYGIISISIYVLKSEEE